MAGPRLFLIDDDREDCADVEAVLGGKYTIFQAHSGDSALEMLDKVGPDVILLDVDFGKGSMSGLEILERVRARENPPPVIMLSGSQSLSTVVRAMKMGAFHYIAKPADLPELINLLEQALASSQRVRQIQAQRDELGRLTGSFVAGDDHTFRLLETVDQVAETETTVLITGESGTGKEMVARRIHEGSPRRDGTFVGINCGAVPADIIESEIFGHVKGAFTGADSLRVGKFEMAAGGTLFLDEIGESPLPFQVKLLRVLGENVFARLGDNQDLSVDTRVLAATSKDLEKAIAKGEFRAELFYRLNIYRIHLVPLRERRGDILPLARHFLTETLPRFRREIEGFSPAVETRMVAEHWHGNVRELRNFVERAVINCKGGMIGLGDMFGQAGRFTAGSAQFSEAKDLMVREWETRFLTERLTETGGNVTQAAELSGMNRQGFQRKMRELGLRSSDFQS
jgi:two-component system response regulator AtoC